MCQKSDLASKELKLKLERRLHAYQVGTNPRSGTKLILRSSDWLMCSELGYFAYSRSLISGFKEDAATLNDSKTFFFCDKSE